MSTAGQEPDAIGSSSVFHRLGVLARTLHDALRELGYDRTIGNAVNSLPDARARLAYVSKLTGDAAARVLDSVDRARVEQELMAEAAAGALGELGRDPAAAVASGRLLRALEGVCTGAARTSDLLTEIMLAQDFHDLTGQVIHKVVDLAHGLERELLSLLVDASPGPQRPGIEPGILNGPVIDAAQRADVVTGQEQVDELLASLGF